MGATLSGEHVERRLAAILAADVAGSCRLIGIDEEGTLARLKALRRTLFDPKIAEHHGRIVKNAGDGAIAEFASVVDAVRCADEIQRDVAEQNIDVPHRMSATSAVSFAHFSKKETAMSVANPKTSLSVRDQVSKDEWEVRVNLGAAYRLVALYGWDDLVFTHISARVPGPEHHFLINPYGWMFEEITASSLVKVDLEDRKVMPSEYDINPAGFTIHSAVHAARQDAFYVMHTP